MDGKDIFQIVPFTRAHGFEIVEASKSEFSLPVERWNELFEDVERGGPICTVLENSVPVACLGVYVRTGRVWLLNKFITRAALLAEVVRTFLLVSAESNGLTELEITTQSTVFRAFLEYVGFECAGPVPDDPDNAMLMIFKTVK